MCFAQTLAIPGIPPRFVGFREARPQQWVVYTTGATQGAYHYGQLLRITSAMAPAFGEQTAAVTPSCWALILQFFSGSRSGAEDLGLTSYVMSSAVTAAITQDLSLVPPYTLLDLSCSLCLRRDRQYHVDEGRPFAVRALAEGRPAEVVRSRVASGVPPKGNRDSAKGTGVSAKKKKKKLTRVAVDDSAVAAPSGRSPGSAAASQPEPRVQRLQCRMATRGRPRASTRRRRCRGARAAE